MPTNPLYDTWIQRFRELHPTQRITRIKNLAWLMIGIHKSRSVYLSRIAVKIPGSAKLPSIVRRLARFLDNPAIRVREWYEPIARQWLVAQFSTIGEIRLIVDGTKVGFAHQLLMVQSSLSETSHSDCLDMGQACSWTQYGLQATCSVRVRQKAHSTQCNRFSGWRY